MKGLNPIIDEQVDRKSSIYQHKDLLCTLIRGEWCPIIFNQVDGVECGNIKYHKYALRLRPGLNWTFPVGTCKYVKNDYILTGKDKIELNMLPKFYGEGFYKTHKREKVFTNIGNGALGLTKTKILRVGKDCVISKKILDPIA